ncbi:hypothetical protein AMJ74_00305 [candidate division WOR_3 bacterium SM1_77]|uniref:Uncharacterized protein n=1 Tax=candidate division WOR_3 bacterium SM1_77 TaxID=1703778 RepID=A0A0S8K3Z2_UNCW3|nr:MAG: hypothetical protein AMJ74_00305 [candidate division WOR_3 bacterium SM1_77]
MKIKNVYIILNLLICISCFVLNCAARVISPHVQNELIIPNNTPGVRHEIGGAFAYNKWIIDKEEGVIYSQTYPSASFSLYYNPSYTLGKHGWLGLIGGLEVIGAPLAWSDPDVEGFAVYTRPYAGVQLNGSVMTLRSVFSPVIMGTVWGDGEWITGAVLADFTAYQSTLLLHNPRPTNHAVWGGYRVGSGAHGPVAGYGFAFNKTTFLRAEYSYLSPKLFASFVVDREEVGGNVHYLTLGLFKQLE